MTTKPTMALAETLSTIFRCPADQAIVFDAAGLSLNRTIWMHCALTSTISPIG